MLIFKEFTFDAAHKLPDYDGNCAKLHGHTYRCQLGVRGNIGQDGMVIDFVAISEIISMMCEFYDHKYLNDLMQNPTVENLAIEIFDRAQKELKIQKYIMNYKIQNCNIEIVRLWETPTSWIEVTREDYENM